MAKGEGSVSPPRLDTVICLLRLTPFEVFLLRKQFLKLESSLRYLLRKSSQDVRKNIQGYRHNNSQVAVSLKTPERSVRLQTDWSSIWKKLAQRKLYLGLVVLNIVCSVGIFCPVYRNVIHYCVESWESLSTIKSYLSRTFLTKLSFCVTSFTCYYVTTFIWKWMFTVGGKLLVS